MAAKDQLKQWRSDQGLTQKEAAEMLDVEVRTYQYWESGKFAPNREASARVHAVAGIATTDWISSPGTVEEHVG